MQHERMYAWPHHEDGEARAHDFYDRVAPKVLDYQKLKGHSFVACCVCSYIHGFLVIVFVQDEDLDQRDLESSIVDFIARCDIGNKEGLIDYAEPILATVNSMNIDSVLSELMSPMSLITGVATQHGQLIRVTKRPEPKKKDDRPKCYCGSGKRLENCHGFKDRPVYATNEAGEPHPADAHRGAPSPLPTPTPLSSTQTIEWNSFLDGTATRNYVILDPYKQHLTIGLAGENEERIFFDENEGFLGTITLSGQRRSSPKAMLSGYESKYEFVAGFGDYEAVLQVFLSGGAFAQLREYAAAYIPGLIGHGSHFSVGATSLSSFGSATPPLRLIVFRTVAPVT